MISLWKRRRKKMNLTIIHQKCCSADDSTLVHAAWNPADTRHPVIAAAKAGIERLMHSDAEHSNPGRAASFSPWLTPRPTGKIRRRPSPTNEAQESISASSHQGLGTTRAPTREMNANARWRVHASDDDPHSGSGAVKARCARYPKRETCMSGDGAPGAVAYACRPSHSSS